MLGLADKNYTLNSRVSDFEYVDVYNYINSFDKTKNVIQYEKEIKIKSFHNNNLINTLENLIGEKCRNFVYTKPNSICLFFDNPVRVIYSFKNESISNPFTFKKMVNFDRSFILIVGEEKYANKLINNFCDNYKPEEEAKVQWWYSSTHGPDFNDFMIKNENNVKDEYYPWLKDTNDTIESYYQKYIDDPSPILILLGEPGTGKTTFIRNLLLKYNFETFLTHDEDVMKNDSFYIDFLKSESKIMIIEDAEKILLPRESDNCVMSKLLNASDGIIKISDKKFIFTANETNVNKIDQALIRPGRCFDILNFRLLTRAEAEIISTNENIELDENKTHFSLGDIFSKRKNKAKYKKSIGFL